MRKSRHGWLRKSDRSTSTSSIGLIAELVRGSGSAVPPEDRVQPIDVVRLPQTDGERVVRRRTGSLGAQALAAGEVGVILVAGGSGHTTGV